MQTLKPEHLRHAMVASGRVAAVDRYRLAADERRIARHEEARDRRDLLGPSQTAQLVLETDLLAHLLHARHAEHAFEHRRLDESGTNRVGADPGPAVIDREVLGEDDDRALRRVVRTAAG